MIISFERIIYKHKVIILPQNSVTQRYNSMYSINVKFYTLLLLVSLIACKDGKNEERERLLDGKWYLYQAEVDGNKTDRLDGTIYEFRQGKIITNVPQIGEGVYSFDKELLIQKGNQNFEYAIEKLNEQELVLKMSIQDFNFRMTFGRDSMLIQ